VAGVECTVHQNDCKMKVQKVKDARERYSLYVLCTRDYSLQIMLCNCKNHPRAIHISEASSETRKSFHTSPAKLQ
jgi:hypothetical protein